jgi:antitoxin HicB
VNQEPARRFVAVVFADPEDGGYVAKVPAVPGVAGQGETEEEAYQSVREALLFHLESLAETGEDPPKEEPYLTSAHAIELAV